MSAWLPCPDPPPSAPDDYFTCQLDNCYCLWLAAKTTMLCCDKGVNSTCAVMATINCDLQLQNATTYPASRLKSTALDSDLQQCGWKGLCCPFGYTCDDLRSSGMEPLCGINLDQDHAPTKASTTSLPPATLAPATVVSTATVLPGETGSTSNLSSVSAAPNSPPSIGDDLKFIIPTVIAGLLAVVFVAGGLVWWFRKKRAAAVTIQTGMPTVNPHNNNAAAAAAATAAYNSNGHYNNNLGTAMERHCWMQAAQPDQEKTTASGLIGYGPTSPTIPLSMSGPRPAEMPANRPVELPAPHNSTGLSMHPPFHIQGSY